jgi:hypothetical protein
MDPTDPDSDPDPQHCFFLHKVTFMYRMYCSLDGHPAPHGKERRGDHGAINVFLTTLA